MTSLVFHTLNWPAPVVQLYAMSRDLAWSVVGLVAASVALRSMWPALAWPGARMPLPLFLERITAAALMGLAGLWGIQAALAINNAVVSSILSGVEGWTPPAISQGVLSPLLVLAAGAATLVLMMYLALFYAMRAIELFVLTAAIPWFALWWATRDDDAVLSNLGRELAVVIFVQSFHAGAYWLAMRMLSRGGWGMLGSFMDVALLWYMTRIPGQMRRLAGAPVISGRLWR